jgi:hypothetical protein
MSSFLPRVIQNPVPSTPASSSSKGSVATLFGVATVAKPAIADPLLGSNKIVYHDRMPIMSGR